MGVEAFANPVAINVTGVGRGVVFSVTPTHTQGGLRLACHEVSFEIWTAQLSAGDLSQALLGPTRVERGKG